MFACLTGFVLAGGVLAAPAGAAIAAGTGPSRSAAIGHPPGTAGDPQAVASRQARASGRAVEVSSLDMASSTVYAEPDGTMRAVITAQPTRTRRGASWLPIDPTLHQNADATLSPAATDVPLALSGGGGATPLVTIGSGAQRVDLSWPSALPTPVLSGASARYPNVLPGVDVQVTANDSGFSEVLVVHDRAAAQRLLAEPPSLLVSSPGLTVREAGDGSLAAVDAAGRPVCSARAASLWHRSWAVPTGCARTARVGTALRGGRLTLTLDRAMVQDPATNYPLSVDPSFTGAMLNWTNPLKQSPGVSFWNGQNLSDPTDPNGPIMVGVNPSTGTPARALFTMNTSSVAGKDILGATFRITEGWADSCTASEVDLWWTGVISSSTTWNNQPSWLQEQSSVTTAHRNGDSSCGQAQIAFGATSAVKAAASSDSSGLTLGLRVPNEGSGNTVSWKRFDTNASLEVDYNSIPTVGAMSTNPVSPCVSGGASPASNDPLINTATPTLTAFADTADTADTNLTGDFQWQQWNGSAWVAAGAGNDPTLRAANTQTSFTIPSGSLADRSTYRWQVKIASPQMSPFTGTDFSAPSQWCEFQTDFEPPVAPAVSSSIYTSDCASCGGVGTTGTFTLSDGSSDVTGYLYGFSDPPSVSLAPTSPGSPVSFNFTPSHGGPTTLFVQAKDAGGNISAQTRYSFTVAAPAPTLARWLLQDAAGSTTLADSTGNGNTATLGSGTLGAPSRIVGLTALSLNGTSDFASAPHLLDTSKSYTVSAWVKLGPSPTGLQGIVSEAGTNVSPFALQYDPGCGCFGFSLAQTDTQNAPITEAFTPAVKAGVWMHVAGVFDAATGDGSIYLDGQQAGTTGAPVAVPWNASGGFQIGRAFEGGAFNHFAGSISDVQVWPRVLFPAEIRALADPSENAQVLDNSFESVGSSFQPDGSPLGLGHDLTLEGTAQVTGAGSGLVLDGAAGFADTATSGPVLHTDQSFTVTATVQLDGSALPTNARTAVSQIGVKSSAFFLGYRLNGSTPSWAFVMTDQDGDASVAGGSTAWSANPVTTADLGKLHVLTAQYDAATGTMTLFVDGQLAGTATRTLPAWDATGNFVVGAAQWTPAGGTPGMVDFWPGSIQHVRAYQGVLTAPAGSWQFAGCTGSPAACPDSGSGGHPLTLSGTGASVVDAPLPNGQPGPLLSLDGAAGLASTTAPVLDTTQSFTVGAWVNAASLPASGSHVIVSQSGNNKSFFELQYNADAKQLCFQVFGQDAVNAPATTACGPSLAANQWMYVAGVYDATGGSLKLYTAVPGSPPSLGASAAFTTPWFDTGANAEVRVGAGFNGGGMPTAFFGGQITDVQLLPGVIGDLSTLM